MENLNQLISFRQTDEYQRDSFDTFLRKIKFKYTVPSIHVAGTNGKGSTCEYIASIYKEAGFKVGIFTSPTLFSFNDDIKINGVSIKDDEIIAIVNTYKREIEKYGLSPFEVQTFIAFSHFQNSNCDVAVIECGMGGLVDATNIFEPILSILTSVSLEHTSYLGRSIYEITENKLGIVRENGKLLIGKLPEEAMEVVKNTIKEENLTLIQPTEIHNLRITESGLCFDYYLFRDLKIKSSAEYSAIDASLAIEAVTSLKDIFPVANEDIYSGLDNIDIPLRFEIISSNPRVILDGSHNPEGMEKFVKSLENLGDLGEIHTLFACFRDKNLLGLLSTIGLWSTSLTLTTFDHQRARTFEDFFLFAEEYKFEENAVEALNKLIEEHSSETIVVTGSLAFVSYIRKMIMEGKINVSKK